MKTLSSAIAILGIAVSASALAGPDGDRYTAADRSAHHSKAGNATQITQTTGFAKYQFNKNENTSSQPDTEISAFEKAKDKPFRIKRWDRNI
ncbi:MAG: hypothetical protein R3208_10085 [Ketobacteraceae bacterium]|nr:hypothetical protein [Ketobacteraceae bacterium]